MKKALLAFSFLLIASVGFSQSVTEQKAEVTESSEQAEVKDEYVPGPRNPDDLKAEIITYREAISGLKNEEGTDVSAKQEYLKQMIAEWESLTSKKWREEQK